MVKVYIEVRNGATRFDVAVQAESVRRAMSIVGGRYPGRKVGFLRRRTCCSGSDGRVRAADGVGGVKRVKE